MNVDKVYILEDRGILYINGNDCFEFLQNLITNNLNKVSENSWHSAGVNTNLDYRFTSNWLLNREGSPHQ